MEYIFFLLTVGAAVFMGIRMVRNPVAAVSPAAVEPEKVTDTIGVGLLVSVPFARRNVIGRVTRVRGRRVRILVLVKGHTQVVCRKTHQLRPARV